MVWRARADRSAERAVLVWALGALLNEETPAESPALTARSLDWNWILRRAEDERLASLLYVVFRALPSPVPILDRLRTAWVAGRRQHILGIAQLGTLLAAFEREGVSVIPLKGPALAEAFYPDPGLRPLTDLDLLIRGGDVPRALQLVSRLGYRHLAAGRPLEFELAYAGAACFTGAEGEPAGFPLDLHWELLTYPGIAPARAMDDQEVWGRAVKVEWWNRPALALCPEDLLIYLAFHWAVHHAFAGLIWPLDLALLLRRHGAILDWEAVGERARRWRVGGALYFALREVQEQLAGEVPPSLLARLKPRGLRRSLLAWLLRRRSGHLARLDYLIPLLLMDRGSDLLRVLASDALPAAGWVRSRYGKRSLLGAYRAHYGRIGRVCLRTFRVMLPLTHLSPSGGEDKRRG